MTSGDRTCNRHGLAVWTRDVSGDNERTRTEMSVRLLIMENDSPRATVTVGGMAWTLTVDDLRSLRTAIDWILP